jgi:NlpC/P60 family protein
MCVPVLGAASAACAGVPAPDAITAGASVPPAAWGGAPAVRTWAPLPGLARDLRPLPLPGGFLPSRGVAFTATVSRLALRYLGRPYQWSGIGQRGFDCSGLVFRVFGALGMVVPHSSFGQYQAGTAVPARLLGPGDLVFFHTYNSGPSHVGIYLGAGRFIHASVTRGVVVSSMDEPYYRSRYLGARRY